MRMPSSRGRNCAILVALWVLVGCATQGTSTVNYTPPNVSSVANERMVERPHGQVWDELVGQLSKSFFVINNIEKESRIINISFNSNTPAEFVDCGRTRRTYTQGEKVEVFDYAVADKSFFKHASARQEHPAFANYSFVRREPTLEGRTNIYVAPRTGGGTVVSVNTRYVLSIRVKTQDLAQHVSGNVQLRGGPREDTPSYIFNTNKPVVQDIAGTKLVCAGTGRLESEVLKFVR